MKAIMCKKIKNIAKKSSKIILLSVSITTITACSSYNQGRVTAIENSVNNGIQAVFGEDKAQSKTQKNTIKAENNPAYQTNPDNAPMHSPQTENSRHVKTKSVIKPNHENPNQNNNPQNITVKKGQTLYQIAQQYNQSQQNIIRNNQLKPPYHLNEGQILNLTNTTTTHNANQNEKIHTVSKGETLYSLARTYQISPNQIAQHNQFTVNRHLVVGETIHIPQNKTTPAAQVDVITEKPKDQNETKQANEKNQPKKITLQNKPKNQTPEARSHDKFRWPIVGKVIMQYGEKNNGVRNDGINIAAPEGTHVRAAENGIVAYAGDKLKGYGNLILIRHQENWVTAYAHNKEINVKRGDQVKRGQVIAKVGKTGDIDKPQLHFEIRKGAQAVNPVNYLVSTQFAGN